MLSTIAYVFRHPALRVYGILMFIFACANSAVMPYRSLMAIDALGMSEQAFSLLVFFVTVANLTVGVSIGIFSDFAGNRKRLMAIFAVIGTIGSGLIWLFPTVWAMSLAMIFILPFSNGNPLIYAGVRSATSGLPQGEAASVNSVVRTSMSAAWVLIPVGAALFLEIWHLGVMSVWGLAAALYASAVLIVLLFLPAQSRATNVEGGKSGFIKALRELGRLPVIVRVLSVSFLTSVNWLNTYLQPLIIKTTLGGTLADAGFQASAVAFLEIPSMLIWAAVLRKTGPVKSLVAGAVIYALYMVGLGAVHVVWQVFALVILGGFGAGAILSIPISYLQDLFPERPGLGTSLLPIHSFLGSGIAAGVFAASAPFTSYQGAAWIGAAVTLVAAFVLVTIEKTFNPVVVEAET